MAPKPQKDADGKFRLKSMKKDADVKKTAEKAADNLNKAQSQAEEADSALKEADEAHKAATDSGDADKAKETQKALDEAKSKADAATQAAQEAEAAHAAASDKVVPPHGLHLPYARRRPSPDRAGSAGAAANSAVGHQRSGGGRSAGEALIPPSTTQRGAGSKRGDLACANAAACCLLTH